MLDRVLYRKDRFIFKSYGRIFCYSDKNLLKFSRTSLYSENISLSEDQIAEYSLKYNIRDYPSNVFYVKRVKDDSGKYSALFYYKNTLIYDRWIAKKTYLFKHLMNEIICLENDNQKLAEISFEYKIKDITSQIHEFMRYLIWDEVKTKEWLKNEYK